MSDKEIAEAMQSQSAAYQNVRVEAKQLIRDSGDEEYNAFQTLPENKFRTHIIEIARARIKRLCLKKRKRDEILEKPLKRWMNQPKKKKVRFADLVTSKPTPVPKKSTSSPSPVPPPPQEKPASAPKKPPTPVPSTTTEKPASLPSEKPASSKPRKRYETPTLKRHLDGSLILPCTFINNKGLKVTVHDLGTGSMFRSNGSPWYVRPGFRSTIATQGIEFHNFVRIANSAHPVFEIRFKDVVMSTAKAMEMGRGAIRRTYGRKPTKGTTAELNEYKKKLWGNGIFTSPYDLACAAYTYKNQWNTNGVISAAAWFGYNVVQKDIVRLSSSAALIDDDDETESSSEDEFIHNVVNNRD